MSSMGNMKDLIIDYRRHIEEVHNRDDYGNNVSGFHHRLYPDCQTAPRVKDYEFLGEPRLDNR